MKKYFKITKFLFLSLFLVTAFSCKNFLQGSLIKEQLEGEIDYANSPTFTVYISPDNASSGSLISASVKDDCRVTDTIPLDFKLADNYKFLCWQAVKKSDTSVSLSECVSFGDIYSLTTSVTIVNADDNVLASDLLIRPVADTYCSFDSASPEVLTTGVPRDSSISFTFSNALSESNNLEDITITIDNGDPIEWGTYFNAPSYFEGDTKKISIISNSSNRIPVVSGSTKKVTVTIPADFTYDTTAGAEKIGADLVYTYYINSSTQDKTLAKFGISDEEGESGVLRINGQSATSFSYSMSVGDEIDVYFKLNEGFKFKGFTKSTSSAAQFSLPQDMENYEEVTVGGQKYLYNQTTRTYALHITSVEYVQNLQITANTDTIKKRSIRIFSDEGNISPNNTTTDYFEETKIPLTFIANSDVCFVKWQVFLGNTDVSDEDYVSFGNKYDSTTEATFKNSPDGNSQLMIKPYCVARPTIVSTSPTYINTGSLRDSRIQVWFDKEMDPNSIYFEHKEEGGQIKLTESGLENVASTDILTTYVEINGENKLKVYGYIERDDDGNESKVYKNIKIYNYYTKEDLLEYYDVPYFESLDSLVIPVRKQAGWNGPLTGTQITVEISKKMFFSEDSVKIPLSDNEKWIYLVNDQVDDKAPTVDQITIQRVANQFDGSESKQSLVNKKWDDSAWNTGNLAWLKKAYLDKDNQKLSVKFTVKDGGGSGPTNLAWVCLKRLTDDCLSTMSYGDDKTSEYSVRISGFDQEKSFEGDIDITTIASGAYQVYIKASDNNNNQITTENPPENASAEDKSNFVRYYVYIDHTGPKTSTLTYSSKAMTTSSIKFSSLYSNWIDYNQCTSVKVGTVTSAISNGSDEVTVSSSILKAGTDYSATFTLADIFGNTTEVTSSNKCRTLPGSPSWSSLTTLSNSDYGSFKAICTKPSGNTGTTRLYYSIGSSTPAKTSTSYLTFDSNSTSKTVTSSTFKKGTHYYFWLAEVDAYGNISDLSAGKDIYMQPANLKSMNIESVGQNSVKLSWEKSSTGDTTGAYIEYKKASDSSWTYYGIKTENPATISGLVDNTLYSFRVRAYNESKLYSTSSISKEQYTTPSFGVNTNLSYIENGYGKVWFSFVIPDTVSTNTHKVYYKVNNGSEYEILDYGEVTSDNKTWGYGYIKISSYNSGSSYTIKLKIKTSNAKNTVNDLASSETTVTINANSDKTFRYNGKQIIQGNRYLLCKDAVTTYNATAGAYKLCFNGKMAYDVTLNNFQVGSYEVTNELYSAVMLRTKSDNYPVVEVTWFHSIIFCNKLSRILGLNCCYDIYMNSTSFYSNSTWDNYTHDKVTKLITDDANGLYKKPYLSSITSNGIRLPTEAEWEFAAFGGTTQGSGFKDYWSGTTKESELVNYAWYKANSNNQTHIVGLKKKVSTFGNSPIIYDMAGNVWEWVWDMYNADQRGLGVLTGPTSYGSYEGRVVKGGSCKSAASDCKISAKDYWITNQIYGDIGFRIARTRTNSDLDKQ